ncbi:GtrA-like protein [Devosia sp. YR412]|uniref:GtrA family protein n=1 Tax=Devosia sp. YR412 TaxID=1881030 RepID=UPI0008D4733E|nr:GtrA family protein [Devosia sp. YR412]SEQ07229.1 GtrA-like protein [Devosia sp. YR412]
MSAALESLMRDAPEGQRDAPLLAGLIAFLAVGGAGAVAFVLLSTVMIWLNSGAAEWLVNSACYAVLIVPVYLLHRRFSFQSDASHRQALPRYMAVQGMAVLLTALFSYVIHGVFAFPTHLSSVLVIGLTSGVNFMVLRGWAFARARLELAIPA